jgi:hypothetical protein
MVMPWSSNNIQTQKFSRACGNADLLDSFVFFGISKIFRNIYNSASLSQKLFLIFRQILSHFKHR